MEQIMGRFYQLSKKISEQEASEIMREVLELSDIRDAELGDDRSRVRVETKDNVFVDVMSTVVNIFSCLLRDLLIRTEEQ